MIDEHIACFVTSIDGRSFSVSIFDLTVLGHGMLVLEYCTESSAAKEALVATALKLHDPNFLLPLTSMSNRVMLDVQS